MNKGLVSVVLPIYNVEKYLDKCISSVVNQTYRDLEILLIDDGSTDASSKMCDLWAEKDSRIKVIHKENQGSGMARNTGIEYACGEFICFFDSDDFIAPETIQKSYEAAVKNNSEIVLFGIKFTDKNGVVSGEFVSPLGYVNYEEDEIQRFFLPELIASDPKGDGTKLFYMSPCLMLYSMSVIKENAWRFVSERDIISEDVYSLLKLFKHIKSVSVIPEAFYYYRKNDSSLSRVFREDRFEKLNEFYVRTKALCEELGYDGEIIHRVSKPYLSFAVAAMEQEAAAPRSAHINKQRIKLIINDGVLQSVLKMNKKDNVTFARKVLFFAIINRLSYLCYLLLKSKAKK